VILFGLDLQCLEMRRSHIQKKSYSHLKSESQKIHRLKQLALDIQSCSKELFEKHGFFETNLNYLGIKIFNEQVKIDFAKSTLSTYLDSIVYACDKGLISQDSCSNFIFFRAR
ncbi:15648_t:CDS:1, partial [Racocetra persica]